MIRPHCPLVQASGRLLKYFCISSLGFVVALLVFGAMGASAIIPVLVAAIVPILTRVLIVIFCLISIGVFWESIR